MEEIRQNPKKGVPHCPNCGRAPVTTWVGAHVMVDCWLCKIGTSTHDTLEQAEADWTSSVQEWILKYQFENGCCDPETFEQQISYNNDDRGYLLKSILLYAAIFISGWIAAAVLTRIF